MGDRGHEDEGLDRVEDRNVLEDVDSGKIPGHRGGRLLNPIAWVTS